MNIGIVTTWFERGAAYVSKQFEEILSTKHNVYIYARGGEAFAKGDSKWDKPNVHWSQYPVNYQYMDKKEFVSWLKKNNIELVIFNEQWIFLPVLWCKEQKVKTVAYIDYYTAKTIPFFDAYDAVICNTKRHLSAFEDHPNPLYIPWGTDTELFKPIHDDGKLVEEGKIVFFNSAGMNPRRKGTDTFIRALEQCKGDNRIKALIHSQKNLREFFPELRQVIDELVLSGMLEIVERTIPAPGLYYKADVYVYPSVLDGIGLTVPEAISSGLACVASDNPPMNEFFDQTCGSLIPITRLYARPDGYYWPQCRCDVDALANIMINYVSHPEKVVSMKKNARKYALENLCFEKNAGSINSLLETVEFSDVDEKILLGIKNFTRTDMLRDWMIKHKLYLIPNKRIRKYVRYHGY